MLLYWAPGLASSPAMQEGKAWHSWAQGRDPGPAVPAHCLVTDHGVAVGWAYPVSAGMAARPGPGSQDADLAPCSAHPCHPAMGAMTACGQTAGVQ